jgi:hypothetical protein
LGLRDPARQPLVQDGREERAGDGLLQQVPDVDIGELDLLTAFLVVPAKPNSERDIVLAAGIQVRPPPKESDSR